MDENLQSVQAEPIHFNQFRRMIVDLKELKLRTYWSSHDIYSRNRVIWVPSELSKDTAFKWELLTIISLCMDEIQATKHPDITNVVMSHILLEGDRLTEQIERFKNSIEF